MQNDTLYEERYGLGSYLYVLCRRCSSINSVKTDSIHTDIDLRGTSIFNYNSKASLVMNCVYILN